MSDNDVLKIRLAQIDELMNRLRVIENPADVELPGGGKAPALPLADERFFAARRLHALDDRIEVLTLMGLYEEAGHTKQLRSHIRSLWMGLVTR